MILQIHWKTECKNDLNYRSTLVPMRLKLRYLSSTYGSKNGTLVITKKDYKLNN